MEDRILCYTIAVAGIQVLSAWTAAIECAYSVGSVTRGVGCVALHLSRYAAIRALRATGLMSADS
ncbi:hypothetical protein CMK11_07230 [Candidatus Poribacteria bacterium]|nr:hypothetical protein [Candidatus Poribacteria bacterium]